MDVVDDDAFHDLYDVAVHGDVEAKDDAVNDDIADVELMILMTRDEDGGMLS